MPKALKRATADETSPDDPLRGLRRQLAELNKPKPPTTTIADRLAELREDIDVTLGTREWMEREWQSNQRSGMGGYRSFTRHRREAARIAAAGKLPDPPTWTGDCSESMGRLSKWCEGERPPLSDQERRVLDLIREVGPMSGITGAQIISKLGNGWPVEQSTLTRNIIPILKQWYGVRNRPNVGYYVPA